MNISVNGQSRIPPGFRFHPTEEELLQYYLRKKVANEKIDLDVIFEVDLNKLEPWDIQEKCRIGTTPQNDWYFFSHKDKKYPTGTRTNRATVAGFWKATGRDKVIHGSGRRIGMRKTLVFYKGRAPHGQKSDWIMHEYRLDDNNISSSNLLNNDTHVTNHGMINNGEFIQEEGWVVCRIFKKKNLIKTLDNHNNTTSSFNNNNQNNHNHNSNNLISSSSMMDHQSHYSTMLDSPSDHDHDHDHDDNDQGALEQIFQTLGTHSKFPQINKIITKSTSSFNNNNNNNNNNISSTYFQQPTMQLHQNDVVSTVNDSETDINNGDWAALDRLVATHLNGHHDHTIDSMTSIFTSSSSSTNLHQHDHDHHDVDIQLPPLRSSPSDDKNYHNTPSNNNNNNTLESYNIWSFTRASLSIDPLCHVSDGGI